MRKKTKNGGRKPRADAQHNRERILKVAKLAFTRTGADISLDDVAKQSGVGPGTLYRHFPTRGALLEAVYRSELERLAAAQQDFSRTKAPVGVSNVSSVPDWPESARRLVQILIAGSRPTA